MDSQNGLSLYLAVMLTAIILAIVFGITTILLVQLEAIKGMENSVVAFYAADTGIEQVLDSGRLAPVSTCTTEATACPLDNGSKYYVVVNSGGLGGCPAGKLFCIKSAGIYKGAKRSIEVKY
ncbi:MAG: hypothetical protein A2V72_01385 [Candidatus Nealsonbacteria bacterium RBG_13_37_56]|uniref:Type 4 fimbrial biogenesis protein PilX N-terminal domain-containing protein n=1 Tax=Candidatus Nealsonbacteria bacterium RBG_13_37_56 TaxID=1801661 RepID=A0A1G2DXB2_9BACT|nr:MAG: hypothetical protein A2V72_01385 [Candidatus Nealsonbacteria bacterium RBG_13_37_56]